LFARDKIRLGGGTQRVVWGNYTEERKTGNKRQYKQKKMTKGGAGGFISLI